MCVCVKIILHILCLAAPSDYTDITRTLTFRPGNIREVVSIPITEDIVSENTENFFASLTLETQNVNVELSPQETEITITDNDGNHHYVATSSRIN